MRGVDIRNILCTRANNAYHLETQRSSNVVDPNTISNQLSLNYYSQINGDVTPNLPQVHGWMNGLLDFGLHSTNAGAQIYIAQDFFLRTSRSQPFKKIIHEGNIDYYVKKYLDSQE